VLPVKAQCLPFTQIPHTTRLFTDFLAYSPDVRAFYPHSPRFNEWAQQQTSAIQYDSNRREQVSAILRRQNESFGASSQTFENIDRLRAGAGAIVTGQQVGLFGGPMFAIYKALTAVKLAEEASAAGINTVPIFWLASNDHDLAEVNHVSLPRPDGLLHTITTFSHGVAGAPVSDVRFGEEIVPVVEEAASLLGESEATELLRGSYRPGETMGTAFARFYARLFSEWGVILLDASDAELHRLAAPIYRATVARAEDVARTLLARGQALETAGYHQQVKVTSASVLLFTMRDGARTAIHKRDGGKGSPDFVIGAESGAEKISSQELLARIDATPESFSPNVLLRPVVQDYLLPTLAYTGGAAEAAYFAQAGAVYELLLDRVTPIVPRFSATIVEPKVQRWLRQYNISVREALNGYESLRQALAARSMPADLQAAFERADRSVTDAFSKLKDALEKLDSTLVDASQTAGSKVKYQLEKLHERAMAAELRRSEVVSRHAAVLSDALYPENALQERGIAGVYFIARQGTQLIRDIYEAMKTDCQDHQILEL
jgi:bacillithiol synthase